MDQIFCSAETTQLSDNFGGCNVSVNSELGVEETGLKPQSLEGRSPVLGADVTTRLASTFYIL
jgi:hypothetical protein